MSAIRRLAKASLVALLLSIPAVASADGQLRSLGLPVHGLASRPPLPGSEWYLQLAPEPLEHRALYEDRHYEWGPLSVDVVPTERKATAHSDAFDAGMSFGSSGSRRAIEICWRDN